MQLYFNIRIRVYSQILFVTFKRQLLFLFNNVLLYLLYNYTTVIIILRQQDVKFSFSHRALIFQ